MIFKRKKKHKEELAEKTKEIKELREEADRMHDQREHRSWLIDTLERTVKAKDAYIAQLEKNDAARVIDRSEVM